MNNDWDWVTTARNAEAQRAAAIGKPLDSDEWTRHRLLLEELRAIRWELEGLREQIRK